MYSARKGLFSVVESFSGGLTAINGLVFQRLLWGTSLHLARVEDVLVLDKETSSLWSSKV